MNRLAVFVEGETEQLFVERLVRELAGNKGLHVENTRARGGVSTKRRTRFVKAGEQEEEVDYYVLIVDCGSDGGVKSRLREEYRNIDDFGYGALIALRDAPEESFRYPRFQVEWPTGIPNDPIQVVFVLAIMEIEAWFLAEHTHFQHINPNLTAERILEELKFDPRAPNLRERDRPASDLDDAYGLIGERYQKGRAAQRTIYLLDLDRMYLEIAPQELEMQRLMEAIDIFLALPA